MKESKEQHPTQDALVHALRDAAELGRGIPPEIEALTRAFAAHEGAAGVKVEVMLAHLKALVREHAGRDEPIFTPKMVGWAVAGYFAGHRRSQPDKG